MKPIVKISVSALLCGVFAAGTCACFGGGGGGTDINFDIDFSNKPTLNVLMPNSGYDTAYINADENAKVVERVTGYKVNYSQLPATQADSNLGLQLGDHAAYNAIKLTSSQFSALVSQDVLLDLKPAIDAFGPVLKEVISEESWATVTVDGKIYGIPERSSSDNIQYPVAFRQDWLDALNLDIPSTPEELYETLKALKAAHTSGNTAFYPLTFDQYTPVVWAIAAGFGIYADWQEYEIDGKTEIRYYMDAPGYKDYVDFMAKLYEEGLIDREVNTRDSATCMQRFTSGNAAAISTSVWSVTSLVTGLSQSIPDAATRPQEFFGYLRALKNEKGEEHANRLGGCPYVTAIPFYMAENAGYVIDWINSKLTDTAEAHNFRDIVLGDENVHWTYNPTTQEYLPLGDAFNEKDTASYYLTGSNETVYTQYWLARVHKQPELFRVWSLLMRNADMVGVYDALDFAPPIAEYADVRAVIELYSQDQFYVMLATDKGTGKLNEYLTKWKKDGGTSATNAINKWFASK